MLHDESSVQFLSYNTAHVFETVLRKLVVVPVLKLRDFLFRVLFDAQPAELADDVVEEAFVIQIRVAQLSVFLVRPHVYDDVGDAYNYPDRRYEEGNYEHEKDNRSSPVARIV